MEITEFRIGNLIKVKDKIVTINSLSADGYNHYVDDYGHFPICCWEKISESSPILLTEEWFFKFGFKRLNYALVGPATDSYLHPEVSIWNPPGDEEFRLNDTVHCPIIVFVHQLQNLYFALTGQELKIIDKQ